MLTVAAFTSGKTAASARFRVRQYVQELSKHGIEMLEFPARLGAFPPRHKPLRPLWGIASVAQRIPAIVRSQNADVTLLQREMISTLVTLEGLTSRPRLLDVDDAIFVYREGRTARKLARMCDWIVCGNRYLAEHFTAWNSNTVIIPTAVDTNRYCPGHRRPDDDVVIGWSGGSEAHREMMRIRKPVAAVLQKHAYAKLLFLSDREPDIPELSGRMQFVPWSERIEAETLQRFDIGLMPLEDTPWNRGKCSFKMLLYMSCGAAPIVSPVGTNSEVLALGGAGMAATKLDDWYDRLDDLMVNVARRREIGCAAREIAVKHFSIEAVAPRLARVLKVAAGRTENVTTEAPPVLDRACERSF